MNVNKRVGVINAFYNEDGIGFTLTYRPDGNTQSVIASNADGYSNESKYTLDGELYY